MQTTSKTPSKLCTAATWRRWRRRRCASPETYTTSWQDPSVHRLKQTNASKIALQAMLGAMFVCGAAAYWMMDTRTLLPHNPCSIAGTVSLLAGSEMCG